jgi:hypothetical protein
VNEALQRIKGQIEQVGLVSGGAAAGVGIPDAVGPVGEGIPAENPMVQAPVTLAVDHADLVEVVAEAERVPGLEAMISMRQEQVDLLIREIQEAHSVRQYRNVPPGPNDSEV